MRSALAAEGTFATRGIFAASGFTADSWALTTAVRKLAAAAVAVQCSVKGCTRAYASSALAAAGTTAGTTAGTAALVPALVATVSSATSFSRHYILYIEKILLSLLVYTRGFLSQISECLLDILLHLGGHFICYQNIHFSL